MSDYIDVNDYLFHIGEEINGCDFYRDIFRENENVGELNSDFSKPNAIYLYQNDDKKLKRRVMLADSWDSDYMEYVECNPMTLCSGLSYFGRANKLEMAQQMQALIFDLDGVGREEIGNLFYRMQYGAAVIRSVPKPTYIVSSGSGVHLYYVLDKPIDLYPNIKLQLKALKYDLTFRIWEYRATSKEQQIQYQSINQGFRMVGSTNTKYDTQVVACKVGDRVTLDYLNDYAKAEHRVDIKNSKMTREQAREQYPEWYQRVVVDGDKMPKKWDIKGKQGYALYDWWRSKCGEIKGGHRYFYLMCLSIYACKCDVPLSKLKKDMLEDFEILSNVEHNNALDKMDMESAIEAYSKEYYNFKIDDIEKLTNIRIEKNKRNGRKQELHLKIARATRDILHDDWRQGNGRKSKKDQVKAYLVEHPGAKKSHVAADLGISRTTVVKWYDVAMDEIKEKREGDNA